MRVRGRHRSATNPAEAVHLLDLCKNRNLLIFAGCLVLFQFANASVMPLAGERLGQQHQHESELVTSALVIVPQLVTALIATWVAGRADAWGRKPLLLAGFAVLPVRATLFALVANPWFLVPVQALGGLTAAVIGVLMPLIVADVTRGTGRYNLAQGAVGTATGLGAAASTSAISYVGQFFGYTAGIHQFGMRGIDRTGRRLVVPPGNPAGGTPAVIERPISWIPSPFAMEPPGGVACHIMGGL